VARFISVSRSQEPLAVTVMAVRQADVTENIPVVNSLAAKEEVQVYPRFL
jgi:hypothetical protein